MRGSFETSSEEEEEEEEELRGRLGVKWDKEAVKKVMGGSHGCIFGTARLLHPLTPEIHTN